MKKILVLYQDWNNWFINDYSKFEHWFKQKDGAYDKNNKYLILSLSKTEGILKPESNIEIHLFKSSQKKQLFDLFFPFRRKLKILIDKFKPDYIYSPFIYILSCVPKGNYKVIGFLRDITAEMIKAKGGLRKFYGNIVYLLDYLALKKIDILLYNSPYLENYAKKLGYKGKLIFSPRDIVDKEYFDSANPKEIIEKYNLHNKKIILTVARLSKEKNIEMGIKALKYLPENYVYIIVGEGPERKNLENLTKQLGLQSRVFFEGFIEHKKLWKYYKAANIFWLLSKTEAFPNVILEAWYSKLPIIVSNISSLKKLVKNGEKGIVLNSWNEKELAKITLNLINNLVLYKKLRQKGYEECKNYLKLSKKVRDFIQ